MTCKWLVLLFFFLNALDYWSTYIGISSRRFEEGNPFMALVLDRYGWEGMAAVKSSFTTFIVLMVWVMRRAFREPYKTVAKWCLVADNVIMGMVVISNFWLICKRSD